MANFDLYVDPWQDYKQIAGKLKKRFLRKPNVSEASRQFLTLANRLQHEDCAPYAALCHLAIARCERQSANSCGETNGLRRAARFFVAAEKEKHTLGLQTFHENLQSAIHCYGHAIKAHTEQKQLALAGCLCLELGSHLYRLDNVAEACEYFERASRLLDDEPAARTNALEWSARCRSERGEHERSLAAVEQLGADFGRAAVAAAPNDATSQLLRECEIATILLLILLKSLDCHLSDGQRALMRLYADVTDPTEALPTETRLSEADFLLLQSVVIAAGWKDARRADRALSRLVPRLSPFLVDLGLELVEQLYLDGPDVINF